MRSLARILPLAIALCIATPSANGHGCHHHDPYVDRILEENPGLLADYPGFMGHSHLSAAGSDCPSGFVTPPAGWHNGDTHSHMQWCGDGFTGFWVDADFIYTTQMQPWNLELSSPLIWGAFWDPVLGETAQITEALYDSFVLNPTDGISGFEHPYSVGMPDTFLQMGLEASGFSVSRWGHVSALNISASEADIYAYRNGYVGETGCEPLQDATHEQPFDFVTYTNAIDCGSPAPPDAGFKNDGTGDHPKPLFSLFRTNPEAVTGYAHQFWPIDAPGLPRGWVDPGDGGWNWEDPAYAGLPTPIGADLRCLEGPAGPAWPGGLNLAFPNNFEDLNQVYPVLMAMDAAMGLVDFLEAWDMQADSVGDAGQEDTCLDTMLPMANPPCGDTVTHLSPPAAWYGGYYKLLSAGQRMSVAAGSDSQCATDGCVPQTWVKLKSGETLNYDTWTDNLKRGRVSLSSGGYQAMEMKVNGRPLGAQVGLQSPDTDLEVEIFYRVAPAAISELIDPAQRTIEIIVDGEVVHTVEMTSAELFASAGNYYVSLTPAQSAALDLTESTWVAARLQDRSAHTGAVYAVLDGEPIADCMSAEYWMLYCDYVNLKIDGYAWCADGAQPGSPGIAEFLEDHVGCSEAEIRAHIADARAIFKAIRDYDSPLPAGVERIGISTPQPELLPMGIVTGDEPIPGNTVDIACFNAPAGSSGFLIVGAPMLGHLFLDPPLLLPELCGAALGVVSPFDFWFPVLANSGGYAHQELTLPTPALVAGDELVAQFLWLPPVFPCTATGQAGSSAMLRLTMQ